MTSAGACHKIGHCSMVTRLAQCMTMSLKIVSVIRIAYWGHGWMVESVIYSRHIHNMLHEMRRRLENVLLENSKAAFVYLRELCRSEELKSLTWCTARKDISNASALLHACIKTRMREKEDRLDKNLRGVSFVLASPKSLPDICDPGRGEKVGRDNIIPS